MKVFLSVIYLFTDKVFNADFKKQTARLLMEISRYADCVKVLDTVVSSSEDNIEAWYLLAFANFSAEKYSAAKECVTALHQLFAKPELKDQEIEDATKELEEKLAEIEKNKPEKMEDEKENENENEDDYEDISGSEGNEGKNEEKNEKMEDQKDNISPDNKDQETMEDK